METSNLALLLLKEVLPVLSLVAQWVQVLSAKESITISLVRIGAKRVRAVIDALGARAEVLPWKHEWKRN